MVSALVLLVLFLVIGIYFANNPMKHGSWFMMRRFINWFPLGMTYAFLYMGRYNLSVAKNALGAAMTKEDFGLIFGIGTAVYGFSFLITGPIVDRIGGRKGIMIASAGSSFANILMGIATYLHLTGRLTTNVCWTYVALYGLNMYFQSYGAVSIIKVKAYWFHVRERGVFGAIFGTLISFGVYFAFDWGQAVVQATQITADATNLNFAQKILRTLFVTEGYSTVDATWSVFLVPAVLLIGWTLIDGLIIKDSPKDAGFSDLDTADASSDEPEQDLSSYVLLKKVFTSPVMLTIALVDCCSGIVRNGIMQWYFVFAREVAQPGAEFFLTNWGLLLCFAGIAGSFAAGGISDRLFQSRRGPPALIFFGCMFVLTVLMAVFLFSSPFIVGLCAVLMTFFVIGVHGMMSGTAAADFGGKKATATCSGIVDGFVYLGSGLQSISLGYLTGMSWHYWPLFLMPFTLLGMYFGWKLWYSLPAATQRYIREVEGSKA